jgi:hypothetical protein
LCGQTKKLLSIQTQAFLTTSFSPPLISKKDTFIRPLDLQNNRMDFFSQGPSTKAADPEAIKAEEE